MLNQGAVLKTGTGTLNVGDKPITAQGIDLSLDSGIPSNSPVATFHDTDPDATSADQYGVLIDWGDRTITTGTVVALPGLNQYQVVGTHAYGGGTYPVKVTITGPGGSTAIALATATIADAAFTGTAVPIAAPEGTQYNGVIAQFVDADPRPLTSSYYKALVDWGDGPYASEQVNMPIQDRVDRPLVSTLTIDKGDFTIADLNLKLDITHARVRDLTATLTGPDGTTITLFDKPPSNTANFRGVTLDDEAARGLTTQSAPYVGSYQPKQALSAFDGKDLSGTWTLTITDNTAGFVGRLDSWSLEARDQGVVVPGDNGGFDVLGNHIFALGPNQQVKVDITDSDISHALVTSPVSVTNQPIAPRAFPIQATEGQEYFGVVGVFQDSNPRSRQQDFSADILLPDGSTVPGFVTYDGGGRFIVTGRFAFDNPSVPNADGTLQPLPVMVEVHEVGQSPGDAPSTEFQVDARVENPRIVGQPSSFSITEGRSITGVVGRFHDPNLLARREDYTIQVDWAGGVPQGGQPVVTVAPDPTGGPGDFVVLAQTPVLYRRAGEKPVTITIQDKGAIPNTTGQTLVLKTNGQVADAPLNLTPEGITLLEGSHAPSPLRLGTFLDTNPAGVTGALNAVVDWGDGTTGPATLRPLGHQRYEIVGDHVYDQAGTYTVWVVAVSADGAIAGKPLVAKVANQIKPIRGQLDSTSDLGPSASDGITSVSNPTFVGQAEPNARVRLWVAPLGGGGPVPAGYGFADAAGNWKAPIIHLSDGAYHVFAMASDPTTGLASSELVELTSTGGGPLVIDTSSPRVVSALYDKSIGAFRITFADTGTGVPPSALLNPAVYSLTSPSRPFGFGAPTVGLDPANPQSVFVRFRTGNVFGGQVALSINSLGVTDRAGTFSTSGFTSPPCCRRVSRAPRSWPSSICSALAR